MLVDRRHIFCYQEILEGLFEEFELKYKVELIMVIYH